MDGRVLKIILHRCDEKLKPKSTGSSTFTTTHVMNETPKLELNIKQEQFLQSESNLYAEIPQNNTFYTFGDELEALLKSEPEDYHYEHQPVSETITFYSGTAAVTPNVKVEGFEEEMITDPEPLDDSHTILKHIKCKLCDVELKCYFDLRKHETSVHGFSRNGPKRMNPRGRPIARQGQGPQRQPSQKKKIYQCPICSEYLIESDDVHLHFKNVHNISYGSTAKPKCTEDSTYSKHKNRDNETKTQGQRPRHRQRQNVRSFNCKVCQIKFSSAKNLHQHWTLMHKHLLSHDQRNQVYEIENQNEIEEKPEIKVENLEEKVDNLETGLPLSMEELEDDPLALNTFVLETKCKICGIQTESSLDLQRHKMSVHSYNGSRSRKGHVDSGSGKEIKITCPVCKKFMTRRRNIHRHLQNVHGFSLEKCWEMFPLKRKRVSPGPNDISFTCSICQRRLSTTLKIRRHFREVHQLPRDQCNELYQESLARVVAQLDDPLPHPMTMTPAVVDMDTDTEADVRCNICGGGFQSSLDLRVHEMNVHGYNQTNHTFSTRRMFIGPSRKKKVFECPICGTFLVEKNKVHRHLKTTHGLSYDQCFEIFPLKFKRRKQPNKIVQEHRSIKENEKAEAEGVVEIPELRLSVIIENFEENVDGGLENLEGESPVEQLNDPLAIVTPSLEIKCGVCGIGSKSPLDRRNHEINVHGYCRNNTERDVKVDEQFGDPVAVAMNDLTIRNCKLCGVVSKSSLDLRIHEIAVHNYNRSRPNISKRRVRARTYPPDETTFTFFLCPLCQQAFPDEPNIRQHMHITHELSYKECLQHFPLDQGQGQYSSSRDQDQSLSQGRLKYKGRDRPQSSKVQDWAKAPFICPICERTIATGSIHRHWRDVHKLSEDERSEIYTEYKNRRVEHKDTSTTSTNSELSAKIKKLKEEWFASRMNEDLDLDIGEEKLPIEQLDDPMALNNLILETKCKICGFQSESPLDLRRHKINVHGDNRSGHSPLIPRKRVPPSKLKDIFQCPICEKISFRGKRNVFDHMNMVHGLSFNQCRELFPNERKGQGQEQDDCSTHFTCSLCQNWFTTTTKIRRHWREVHKLPQEKRNQLFLECVAQAQTASEEVQSVEPEWSTEVEELELSDSDPLDDPLAVNLSSQPEVPAPAALQLDLKCKICGGRFKSPLNLRRHEISLHGYNRNGHSYEIRNGHVRVKPPKRRFSTYQCPLCKKFFVENRNVHNHMEKIHGLTKEKCNEILPLKWRKGYVSPAGTCLLCQKKFENTARIHRHLRNVHQVPPKQWRQLYRRDYNVGNAHSSKLSKNVEELEEEEIEQLNDPLALDDPSIPVFSVKKESPSSDYTYKTYKRNRSRNISGGHGDGRVCLLEEYFSTKDKGHGHGQGQGHSEGHSSNPFFSCPICPQMFSTKIKMQIHMRNLH